jgi:hypothetical protein
MFRAGTSWESDFELCILSFTFLNAHPMPTYERRTIAAATQFNAHIIISEISLLMVLIPLAHRTCQGAS